jgi:nucleoside-diphosphate-sugar epimerase
LDLLRHLSAAFAESAQVSFKPGEDQQDLVRGLGASPVVADALDPDAVAEAVASAEPEMIVHELTALSGKTSIRDARHPDRSPMAKMTNRLRTEATDHLLAAGRAVGARRFVAQSFGAFRWARTGAPVHTEADPLDPDPPAPLRPVVEGLLYLEEAVTTIEWGEGLALRYGGFYGPGTSISLAPDAVMAAPIRKRQFPILGDGGGVFSHIHVEDAAAATAVAVEQGSPGVYYIVDDEPAPVREWLPVLARALDAKPPRRVPRWLGRLAASEAATVMMTEARGASNENAKRKLGWQLRYPSWRKGFAHGLGSSDDRGRVRRRPLVGVRRRLPDARQRERCRKCGAGGIPPSPPGARGPRADRVAARLPVDGGLAARARPSPIGAGPAQDSRGGWLPRAACGQR